MSEHGVSADRSDKEAENPAEPPVAPAASVVPNDGTGSAK